MVDKVYYVHGSSTIKNFHNEFVIKF